MISSSTFDFLSQLSQNNSKAWMDLHRDRYLESKEEIIKVSESLINMIATFDPEIEAEDIRFSRNKKPYKENFSIGIWVGGRRSDYAWYYLQIKPEGKSMLWWGVRRPWKQATATIREHILDDRNSFSEIINHGDFLRMYHELQWSSLKRPPKGYEEFKDEAAMKYMKMKDRYVQRPLLDEQVHSSQLIDICEMWYRTIQPFNAWVNECIREIDE